MYWPPTLALMAGTVVGGLAGSYLAPHHPASRRARAGGSGRRGPVDRVRPQVLVLVHGHAVSPAADRGRVAGGMLTALVGGRRGCDVPGLIAAGIPPLQRGHLQPHRRVPGAFLSGRAVRPQAIAALQPRLHRNVSASMIAPGFGAVLLLATPARVFEILVPVLLGFATVLFRLSERASHWLRARAKRRGHDIKFSVTQLENAAAGFILQRLFRTVLRRADAGRDVGGDRRRLPLGQRPPRTDHQPELRGCRRRVQSRAAA